VTKCQKGSGVGQCATQSGKTTVRKDVQKPFTTGLTEPIPASEERKKKDRTRKVEIRGTKGKKDQIRN